VQVTQRKTQMLEAAPGVFERGEGKHGRQRAMDGQRVHRAALAFGQA
jgi:hypothetical protein